MENVVKNNSYAETFWASEVDPLATACNKVILLHKFVCIFVFYLRLFPHGRSNQAHRLEWKSDENGDSRHSRCCKQLTMFRKGPILTRSVCTVSLSRCAQEPEWYFQFARPQRLAPQLRPTQRSLIWRGPDLEARGGLLHLKLMWFLYVITCVHHHTFIGVHLQMWRIEQIYLPGNQLGWLKLTNPRSHKTFLAAIVLGPKGSGWIKKR